MSVNQAISCFVENYDKYLSKITDLSLFERIQLVVFPILLTVSVSFIENSHRDFYWLYSLTGVFGFYSALLFLTNIVSLPLLKGETAGNHIKCLQTRMKLTTDQIFEHLKDKLGTYHVGLERSFKLLNGVNVFNLAAGVIGLTLVLLFIADRRVSMKTIFFLNMASLGVFFLGHNALNNLRSPPDFKILQDDLAKCF